MKTIILDFETYYDKTYTLKKLSLEEYIRDDRFQSLCLAVKSVGEPAYSLRGPMAIREWLQDNPLTGTAVIAHNAAFDCYILNHIYGVRPAFIFDTLSMARAVNGPLALASLERLAERYELPSKTVPYGLFLGRQWDDMSEELQDQLAEGCMHDAWLTEEIFNRLIKGFPHSELEIIDATIRMFSEPRLIGDTSILEAEVEGEKNRKAEILNSLEMSREMFNSSATFLRILEDLGEEVPRKQGANGPIPAIAASDPYMIDNQGRDDIIGTLLRARLDVKSSIIETRAGSLFEMSQRGPMPVYLKYNAAVTTRWGGGDGINWQNLPKDGRLRAGVKAPESHRLIILDFAQIEYRVLCGLAGQSDKLDILVSGRDLYDEFTLSGASRFFKKTLVLGSGYGMGPHKFQKICKNKSIPCDEFFAKQSIMAYRREHPHVVNLWKRLDLLIPSLAAGQKCHLANTPLKFENRSLILPNGIKCRFDLAWCHETRSWFRKVSRGSFITESQTSQELFSQGYTGYWGGALTEFCCQALSRIYLSDLVLRIKKRLGLMPVLLVHDEYVTLSPAEQSEDILNQICEIAKCPVEWWPNGPPIAVEGRIAYNYGKDK